MQPITLQGTITHVYPTKSNTGKNGTVYTERGFLFNYQFNYVNYMGENMTQPHTFSMTAKNPNMLSKVEDMQVGDIWEVKFMLSGNGFTKDDVPRAMNNLIVTDLICIKSVNAVHNVAKAPQPQHYVQQPQPQYAPQPQAYQQPTTAPQAYQPAEEPDDIPF